MKFQVFGTFGSHRTIEVEDICVRAEAPVWNTSRNSFWWTCLLRLIGILFINSVCRSHIAVQTHEEIDGAANMHTVGASSMN